MSYDVPQLNHQSAANSQPNFASLLVLGIAILLLFLMSGLQSLLPLLALKGVLFAALIGAVAYQIASSRHIYLHPLVLCMLAGYLIIALFYIAMGSIRGSVHAFEQGQAFAIWVPAYGALIAGLGAAGWNWFDAIAKTLIVTLLFLGTTGIALSLWHFGLFPAGAVLAPIFDSFSAQVNVRSGKSELGLPGVVQLSFLLPFALGCLIIEVISPKYSKFWQIIIAAALFSGLVFAMLSGRRGLWIALALTLPLTGIFAFIMASRQRNYRARKIRPAILALILAATTMIGAAKIVERVYDIDVNNFSTLVAKAFDPDADLTATVRYEQIRILLRTWSERPFLGTGFGHSIPATSRITSGRRPYSYELQYLQNLFHMGIFGLGLYAAGICWIFFMGLRKSRQYPDEGRLIIPLLGGLGGILLINATNPYLTTFETFWMVFLPVAVLNWLMIGNHEKARAAV